MVQRLGLAGLLASGGCSLLVATGDLAGDGSGVTPTRAPQPDGGGGDTGADPRDGDAGATSCVLTDPFESVRPLLGLEAVDGFSPRLSSDERTVYYQSSKDLWIAKRPSLDGTFAGREPLSAVNRGTAEQGNPSLRGDGLELIYASNEVGGGDDFDLFSARRGNVDEAFPGGTRIPTVSRTGVAEYEPFLTEDGQTLYFASNPSNQERIYVARRTPSGDWGAAQIVDGLGTPTGNFLPVPSSDGTVLYFASVRSGTPQTWQLEVARSSVAPVSSITEAGTKTLPSWLSRDGCRLYGMRESGTDAWTMVVASRRPR